MDGRVARDEERRKGGTRGETLEAARLGGKVRGDGGERCENRLEFAVAAARGGCAGENWRGRGEEKRRYRNATGPTDFPPSFLYI